MSYDAIRIYIESMIHDGKSNDYIVTFFINKELTINNRKRVYAIRFLYEARG